MKKIVLLLTVANALAISIAFAQSGYIYTVAGNGSLGFSGDGGPATSANLNSPSALCMDLHGNMYISDVGNNRIRKVSAANQIITTVVGSGTSGYTGDGGPASLATLNNPTGVAIDGLGNLYIADKDNNVIRKVDPSGIISTVAGTGSGSFSGDGGPAIAASISRPYAVAVDAEGNMYIADQGNSRIREVNTSGIISTIAGGGSLGYSTDGVPATSVSLCTINGVGVDQSGIVYFSNFNCHRFLKIVSGLLYDVAGYDSPGYSGDGGPADSANVEYPYGISADLEGNVYLCPRGNVRVRKVDAVTNIITTIAGTGIAGYSGDGGPATAAKVSSSINGVFADILGNVYFADQGNNCIRMVTSSIIGAYTAPSLSVFVNEYCSGPQLTIATNSFTGTQTTLTNFGDGTTAIDTILVGYAATSGYATFHHLYGLPGTYTIKTLLMNSGVRVDSLTYTYEYKFCNTIAVKYYNDIDSDCAYHASTDIIPTAPFLTEIDSNSIPVDTISSASGFYYDAFGSPGDVYTFRVISYPSALETSCPTSGIITDTLQNITYNIKTQYLGMRCRSTGIDTLTISDVIPVTGEHDQWGNIYITNNSTCIATEGLVTLDFSPKYGSIEAFPGPTSTTANSATWDLSGFTTNGTPFDIWYAIWHSPSEGSLSPGDTVQSHLTISFIGTDSILAAEMVIDTVRAACDPNNIWVSPNSCIAPTTGLTQLKYTTTFVNTGNDTAFNIYILDTLSNNVDISSLRIIMASATMNTNIFKDNAGQNIVKFDFPAINLLDSMHNPAKCSGTVIFTINTKPGLPDSTVINNRAGIYFDYNPVVMTNMVQNKVGCPTEVRTPLPAPSLSLFPNPATTELTIHTNASAYSSYTITNLVDQQMMTGTILTNDTKVNIAALPAGVYFVTFSGENGDVVKKFLKM